MAKSRCCPNPQAYYAALAWLVVGLVGCGDGLRLALVEGTVTLDGAPLEGAAVMLQPTAGGPVASGVTDAQGKFTLHTANRPGAVLGKHQVAVIKQELRGMGDDAPSAEGVSTHWITPQRYSLPATSELTAEIAPGDNQLTLKLTAP